jgi:hypothetical protein
MRKRLVVATLVASASVLSWGGTAAHAADPNCTGRNAIASKSFTVAHTDGTTETFGYLDNQTVNDDVRPGDTVTVTFRVKAECVGEAIGLASYQAESATFVAGEPQTLFDSETVSGSGASQSLTVTVPNAAADGTTGCPNKHQDGPETKNTGANTSGAYNSTCDGRPSGNGNGDGAATGRPCAGCVGNADDKNPPGQAPDGSDANNGYECDGNKGIARENPAHTGCRPQFFQLDFFTGEVLPVVDGGHTYGARLIDAYNGPKG